MGHRRCCDRCPDIEFARGIHRVNLDNRVHALRYFRKLPRLPTRLGRLVDELLVLEFWTSGLPDQIVWGVMPNSRWAHGFATLIANVKWTTLRAALFLDIPLVRRR